MATTTEIDKALDEIALSIDRNRKSFNTALNNISSASNVLSGLPTQYSDVIASINAFGTSDAYEATVKARFAKYVEEFTALKTEIDAVITAIG